MKQIWKEQKLINIVDSKDIISLRLTNHHLLSHELKTPYDVVSYLGAVQSQDYAMAKWSVALRMKHALDSVIESSFNKGEIIRTHVMRPTWHFIAPEDLAWMQDLTSERVKAFMNHYNKRLELTEELFKKSNAAIIKALKGNKYLTRQELKEVLGKIGINGDVQRYAHIIMWAELDGLICSGPRRGKQFTYALVDERIPKVKKISREEALGKLTTRYFTSHGPAQVKDFSWWSGLTVKDAREGLDSIKSTLSNENINGKSYYYIGSSKIKSNKNTAFLLSIFDEYVISYKDRSDISDYRAIEKMITMGNALTAVVIINGKARGTWKRIVKNLPAGRQGYVEIKISPFKKFTHDENTALKNTAEEYGDFLGLKPLLTVV